MSGVEKISPELFYALNGLAGSPGERATAPTSLFLLSTGPKVAKAAECFMMPSSFHTQSGA